MFYLFIFFKDPLLQLSPVDGLFIATRQSLIYRSFARPEATVYSLWLISTKTGSLRQWDLAMKLFTIGGQLFFLSHSLLPILVD